MEVAAQVEDYSNEFQSIAFRNEILLNDIIGERLEAISVHVVPPEINILFLQFADFVVEVFGAYGSELLRLEITNRLHEMETIELKPLQIFQGKEIVQARTVGEPWNGYGFEISFKEMYDRTLLVQSIYSGDKPDGFDDCLRVGIGHYLYSV
jgi:hypothetical protein